MNVLEDRWLLFKAAGAISVKKKYILIKKFTERHGYLLFQYCFNCFEGGNGRRKMSAIALDAEGYTGSVIRRASSGGKLLLYVVPLQDELDLSPLPADAPEFALMPKTTCKQCKAVMPLQMLALHIDQCSSISDLEDEVNFFSLFLGNVGLTFTALILNALLKSYLSW